MKLYITHGCYGYECWSHLATSRDDWRTYMVGTLDFWLDGEDVASFTDAQLATAALDYGEYEYDELGVIVDVYEFDPATGQATYLPDEPGFDEDYPGREKLVA